MAVIANLKEPVTIETVEAVQPLPVGALIDVITVDSPNTGLTSPYLITNRFPVPPTAVAFLTGVDAFFETPIIIEGVTKVIGSALAPEGDFLEPTKGQIWPRIG